MTWFQLLLLPTVGALLILTLLAARFRWATWREAVVWSCVWIAAGLALAWPKTTVVLAKALGIGRGTDLLLYCAVFAMTFGFLLVYARLRLLRRDITVLVRQLALRDAVRSETLADSQRQDLRGSDASI